MRRPLASSSPSHLGSYALALSRAAGRGAGPRASSRLLTRPCWLCAADPQVGRASEGVEARAGGSPPALQAGPGQVARDDGAQKIKQEHTTLASRARALSFPARGLWALAEAASRGCARRWVPCRLGARTTPSTRTGDSSRQTTPLPPACEASSEPDDDPFLLLLTLQVSPSLEPGLNVRPLAAGTSRRF